MLTACAAGSYRSAATRCVGSRSRKSFSRWTQSKPVKSLLRRSEQEIQQSGSCETNVSRTNRRHQRTLAVPRVVPPTSKFNDLQCQTILKALMGAKDNL